MLHFNDILRLARAALLHSDADPEIRENVVRLETGLEGVAVKEVGHASAEAKREARSVRR